MAAEQGARADENRFQSDEYQHLIGTEWDDHDSREEGRRIQVVAIIPKSDDGYGGPVYNCITVASRQPWKIGRRTRIGHHGLLLRWMTAAERAALFGSDTQEPR